MVLKLPTISGRDASGDVVELATGVGDLKPGTSVMGLVTGAYAEDVVAKMAA